MHPLISKNKLFTVKYQFQMSKNDSSIDGIFILYKSSPDKTLANDAL